MEDSDLQAALERDAARVVGALRSAGDAGLAVAVPWCGGWRVRDLVEHLGEVHRWATAATRTPPDGRVAEVEPAAESEEGATAAGLASWFAEGAAALLEALRGSSPAQPCWTLAEPARVAFWTRRQAHETAVHRWDVEAALARPSPVEADLAADGIDEVLSVMAPRQVRLGRAPALVAAYELVADGRTWIVGPGDPVVRVDGTASDLLLLLWGRPPAAAPTVTGDGDAWLRFLRGAPTP